MSERFLSEEELVTLTGRKFPAKQIEALRRMGIQFYVNARNRPVVPISAIEGGKPEPVVRKWTSAVLG